MKSKHRLLPALTLSFAMLLSACSSQLQTQGNDSQQSSTDTTAQSGQADETAASTAQAAVEQEQPAEPALQIPSTGIMSVDQSTSINLKQQLAGKPALVVGWASWCSVCRAQMPYIKQLASKLGGNANVVGINIMETPKVISQYVANQQLKFMVVSDPDGSTANQLGISGLPTSLIVDRNGNVVQIIVGTILPQHQVEQTLQDLINQP